MTTVYGVTMAGARQQILNRLRDAHEDDEFNGPVERRDLPKMAKYLSELVFQSLGENFVGATESMDWLLAAAKLISKESNKPVEWTTPLGWPVLQPYFKIRSRRVRTVFHDMTIIEGDDLHFHENNESAPVQPYKQRQALPPNYFHSLDSSHMLQTAHACRLAGLTFAAVHDSYWTHACDMGTMSTILRDEFVRLHESTGLQQLREEMHSRYSCKLGLGNQCDGYDAGDGPCKHVEGCPRVRWEKLKKPVPQHGELDLSVVRDSTYFFS